MTEDTADQAQLAIEQARQALREKRGAEAQQLALLASRLDPALEDAWLILAAFAPAEESIALVKRALAIHPESQAARQAMHWAVKRLREQQSREQTSPVKIPPPAPVTHLDRTAPVTLSPAAAVPQREQTVRISVPSPAAAPALEQTAQVAAAPAAAPVLPVSAVHPRRAGRRPLRTFLWIAATLLACLVLAATAFVPISGILLAHVSSAPRAEGALPKPSLTATNTPTATPTATATFTATPTDTATPVPTATFEPTATPIPPSPTPPQVVVVSVEPPANNEQPQPPPSGAGNGERWVDVNLSQQTAAAYEGDQVVRSFVVSTGTAAHPTVTGQFRIYVKYQYADMTGPGYYLPNVPYVMYFYEGYGLHGTYWHNNFGTPMSHGCVNFSIPDAAWLFDFASVGTLVNVHY